MKKLQVAVTGGNGFIGSHLMRRLLNDEHLTLTRFDRKRFNLLDSLSLKNFVKGKDIIIHLAGKNKGTDDDLIKGNLLSTAALLKAIADNAPKCRLIFTSSYQIYTQTLYGTSKKFSEEIIRHYSRSYKTKATILRLANVYGPGCRPFYNSVIATFIDLIKEQKKLEVNGNGTQKRDYIYVDDVVDAIMKTIFYNQEKMFDIFDVGSGTLTSLRTIISLLEKIHKQKLEIHYKPVYEKKSAMRVKSIKKITEELRWSPRVSLKKGLTLSYQTS